MKILIIIPAYNEEKNIKNVVEDLKINYPQYDYLIINDCSKDNTKIICEKNKYNYISLPINLGIGGGVQTGYKYAFLNGYDVAIQMDGDGQHDAIFLNNLITPILNGQADMVIGSRFINKEGFQSSIIRRVGINFLSSIIYSIFKIKIFDVTSGFRAVNKRMIEIYAYDYAQDYPEPEAIVVGAINNAKILEVPVIMHERKNGISSISTLKSIYYICKVSLSIVIHRFYLKGGRIMIE